MRKAFTMIELIFVIVIIGILAAVAIPKLAATRDDAKISALADKIATGTTEIVAYSVANGTTVSDFTLMSNAVGTMINAGDAVQNGSILNIGINNTDDCIMMEINATAADTNITMTHGNVGGDTVCQGLQETIGYDHHTIPLTGSRIIR